MGKKKKSFKVSHTRKLRDKSRKFFAKYENNVTRRAFINNYDKFIVFCRNFYDCKTKDECKNHIDDYVDYLKQKGLSPKSLRSHLNVFRQIFKLARKEKIIFDDPSEFVKLPKNTPQKVEVYDSETLKKVFEAIKDDRLFHLIYVTLFFGMRRSEALGIRWDAVDFENKTLTVKHTVVAYNGKVVAKDSTKTDSSNRIYPLSDEIVSMFRWLKSREEEERKLCGSDYIENDYVFKWPNGKPFEPDYVSKHFKKLLKKNNFKHQISCPASQLRRTSAFRRL